MKLTKRQTLSIKRHRKHHTKKHSKAKKKSRKKRPQTARQKHLMKVFREMKSKDKSIKLGDAMRVAKKSYK